LETVDLDEPLEKGTTLAHYPKVAYPLDRILQRYSSKDYPVSGKENVDSANTILTAAKERRGT